jgi:hypothetical protein
MDRLDGSAAKSRREIFARLHHDCMAIHIWMLTPEDCEMKLEDLKKLSTKELTALYNEHAEKQVKRMESRAKLEERTAQLLRDANKLEEGDASGNEVSSPAPQKGKKSKATKPPIEAPSTNEEGNEDMATTKGKKTAAKKATKTAAAKPAAAKKEAGKRGAPLTNLTYSAISEKSKNYNPGGNKLQASSARGIIFAAIQKKGDSGITRQKLEEQFPDQNVKSALDVLIKFGFIKAE